MDRHGIKSQTMTQLVWRDCSTIRYWISRYGLRLPFIKGHIKIIRHCAENVVYKLSLLVVHILKRYSRVLTSFAVQLDFSSDDWSVSFTFAFIWSNVFSPLDGIFNVAIVFAISKMSSILSMSSDALMLQIDNLNAYDQNFISFKLKEALRIAKKGKT